MGNIDEIATSSEPAAGQALGAYELRRFVDRGALGERWHARVVSGTEVGRAVVVRRITRDGLDAAAVARVASAGFSARGVRHPKLAAVLDVVVLEDEIAVVSEEVVGPSLRELVTQHGQPRATAVPAVLRIASDVLDGLVAAADVWSTLCPEGETNLWLRESVLAGLCPETVVVATFGEAMVTDVGVAGVLCSAPRFTDDPELAAYLAPERIAGEPPTVEAQVFSLGTMLWELIAGRRLFTGAAAQALAIAAQTAGLAGVHRRMNAVPIPRLDKLPLPAGPASKPVADFVARALECDPAARYPSLEAMREACRALGDAIGGEADLAAAVPRSGAGSADGAIQLGASGSMDTLPPASNRPTLSPDRVGSSPPTSDRVTSVPGDVSLPQKSPAVGASPESAPELGTETDVRVEAPGESAFGIERRPALSELLDPPRGKSLEVGSTALVRVAFDHGASDSDPAVRQQAALVRNRKIVVGVVAGAALLAAAGLVASRLGRSQPEPRTQALEPSTTRAAPTPTPMADPGVGERGALGDASNPRGGLSGSAATAGRTASTPETDMATDEAPARTPDAAATQVPPAAPGRPHRGAAPKVRFRPTEI